MNEESQKDNILINEVQADVKDLENELANVDRKNNNTEKKIQ